MYSGTLFTSIQIRDLLMALAVSFTKSDNKYRTGRLEAAEHNFLQGESF